MCVLVVQQPTICLNSLPFVIYLKMSVVPLPLRRNHGSAGAESDSRAQFLLIPYSSRGISMNKSVFIAAALALALTACGDNKSAADAAKAAADKATVAAKEAADKAATAAKDAGTAAMQSGAAATDAAKAAGTAAMDSAKDSASKAMATPAPAPAAPAEAPKK
jgi:hypothetical protein